MAAQPIFHPLPTLDHALSIFQALEGEVGIAAVMECNNSNRTAAGVAATLKKILKHVTRAGVLDILAPSIIKNRVWNQ